MRIAIDFQGAQTGSRFRGIGHYSTELVKSLIAEGKDHDFFLILNGAFTETIESIRLEFGNVLPQSNILVWYPPEPIENFDSKDGSGREIAHIIREFFIRSIEPDALLITSVFEGLGEPALVTIKEHVKDLPTAAIFYDFTPLIIPDEHFRNSILHRRWYRHRIEQLKNCDLFFTISESSREELHRFLDIPRENSVNIFGGRSEEFFVKVYSEENRREKLSKLGISKPFILYAGGLEPNKNLKRLVESLSVLPDDIKRRYEFVVVGKRNPGEREKIISFAADGLSKQMINVIGYVSRDDLIDLYNLCSLFTFPSLREGLGLPPAEAMACGAPTIVSDRSSLPEVVANPAAEFDPESPIAIGAKITQVLSDDIFRDTLVRRGLERSRTLTWKNSARTLLRTLEQRIAPRRSYDDSRRSVVLKTGKFSREPLRILTMKLDHNGDFLLAVPAMAKLRTRYPDARIDVVVGSWNSEAAKSLELFDNIYVLNYYKAKSSDRPDLQEDEMNELVHQLPFYDFALDLRRQPDTRFLLVQFPAAKYFGYAIDDPVVDQFLTNPLPRHAESFAVRCEFDSFSTSEQILKLIDQLPFGPDDYITLPEMSSRLPVRTGSVAIFPRVGNEARQWDTERFAALIDSLSANDKISEINLYGGRIEELETVPFRLNPKITLQAGLRFPELLTSLSANQVCVGNNSFGVHLGSYAGCQTIGIYSGHELPQHWGPPFGNAFAITADAPCSPCHLPDKKSCPYDLFCLNDISVQTVERVILDAVEGYGIREDYAKISRINPASAVQPLINEINNSRHLGRISGVSPDRKTRLAAAISVNFPERTSPGRSIYLDVTGLRTDAPGAPKRTRSRLESLELLAKNLRNAIHQEGSVILIGSGPHDHEFYTVDDKDLLELDRVLTSSKRHNRTVRPLAGDIYFGPDIYFDRNPAQWNLLATWRQNGVTVAMQAPGTIASAHENRTREEQEDIAAYLYKLAHYDVIAAAPEQWSALQSWLDEFAPPRLRPLKLLESGPLAAIARDRRFIAALLEGDTVTKMLE